MNVLLIIEGTYPWYRGGVSEWVYQYLQHLPDFNFTVVQIATDEFQGLDPDKALYPITPNILDFIRISPPKFESIALPPLDNWFQEVKPSLSGYSEFDLIHVTNTGFAGWLGSEISERQNIPLVLTEHAIYWKEIEMGAEALECGYQIPQQQDTKDQTVDVFKQLASKTYAASDQIISVSKINIPEQKRLGAEEIHYIPNGIPASWLNDSRYRNENPHIAWVGRCAEMKNPLAFFDYVEAFRSQVITPTFSMLLADANESGLKEEVLQKAQKFPEVQLIWNQAAAPYFEDFDILVLTSHNESQPLVMLEALSKKAIPAGYIVGDFTEEYGLAFSSDTSIQEQVEIITSIWNSSEEFELLVNEKFQKLKEKHVWNSIFNQYKALMTDLAEHKTMVPS